MSAKPADERRMYGWTKAEYCDPLRLVLKAEVEWNQFFWKSDAFDLVKNRDHWKGRIDAVIDASQRTIVQEAIQFFVYGCAHFHAVPGDETKLRVTAPGYWEYEGGARE